MYFKEAALKYVSCVHEVNIKDMQNRKHLRSDLQNAVSESSDADCKASNWDVKQVFGGN